MKVRTFLMKNLRIVHYHLSWWRGRVMRVTTLLMEVWWIKSYHASYWRERIIRAETLLIRNSRIAHYHASCQLVRSRIKERVFQVTWCGHVKWLEILLMKHLRVAHYHMPCWLGHVMSVEHLLITKNQKLNQEIWKNSKKTYWNNK